MRRLAIRSVLSSRVAEERLHVVSDFGLDDPSTQAMRDALGALGIERSVLIVTGTPDRTVHLSARNLPGARVLPADTINVAEMLAHQQILITVDAVRRVEALWGGDRARSRPVGAPPATVEA
jgi:large subunit ribosomal protein L4